MTNNLITLTIPNDDHVALRAFGKALEEMALAHGAEPRKPTIGEMQQDDYKQWYDEALEASNEAGYSCMSVADVIRNMHGYMKTLEQYGSLMHSKAEVDTTAQQVESLAERADAMLEVAEQPFQGEAVPTADKTGTPWDERIHSASKALNADGTWRLRRKPKNMDEAEWAAFVSQVASEIHPENIVVMKEFAESLPDIEPTNEDVEEWEKSKQPDYLPEPPVTPPGDDFHTDAGVVSEQTVAGIPPIPVPPPVVVPPVTDWTFPKLMTFLTERQGKIDVATVNMLLAQDGITSLPELNAHPDKIGPFVTRVKAHLGE